MASTMTEKINAILKERTKTVQPFKVDAPLKPIAPVISQNSLVNKISEAVAKQKQTKIKEWDTATSARKAKQSADDLYKLAEKSGLKNEADRILQAQKGEETNKIFSGGFISDTFDVLNALQYGVTGVLKGKGFMEGVKTRQSFSDKDALGDKGLPGVVAGIALDIAVDPLTYIAPLTILKKVPFLSKVAKAGKEAVFGKMVSKTIKEGEKLEPVISKTLDPLAQEAQKYKSAEEFVKAQPTIYHGTPAKFEKFDTNISEGGASWFTSDKGEILSGKSGAVQGTGQKLNIMERYVKPDLKLATPKQADNLFTDQLISEGYRGVKYPATKESAEWTKLFYPNEDTIIKSQLTDIWNKANKEVGEAAPRAFKTLEGGTQTGKYLAEKFSWMFGQDPVYKKTWERSIKNIGVEVENLSQIARKVADLPEAAAKKLLRQDEVGRFFRVKIDELKDLKPEEFDIVQKAWQKIDDLGKEAVDIKLLSQEKYEENIGEYIKNAYTEYEQAKGKGIFSFMKLGVKGIKSRKSSEELAGGYLKSLDIDEARKLYPKAVSETGKINLKNLSEAEITEIASKSLKGLGQIDNAAYLLFKGSFDLIKDIENIKLFNQTAKMFGSDAAQEGFKQLPKGQRLGELSGKFVPENIFNHIQEITEPFKDTLGKKLIAGFKYNKVILNPATHARNIMSNTILNWWKLGLGPWRVDIYAEAAQQAAKGGKWVDEAKTVGYNLNTFASNELRSLLDSGEAKQFLKGLGGTGAKVKNKLANLYQGEENIAKLAAFIFERKKGLDIEQAWKLAESATFNYAQVTPFIRKLRTSLFGMPFITFSIKSAPIAIETALKHPARISVFGKIKNDIEKAADIKETERERASEPAYIKDGFYIKLPFKDKEGRSAYFDLTYIIPFGDLVSGGLFQRQIKRETGLKESVPEAALSNFPAIQLIKEITKNQDFYGDKIWQDSDPTDKQLKDLMRHLTKTYLPPLVSDQIPGGYMASGDRRIKGIKGALTTGGENQQRTLMQEMLRNVGAKIQPVNVDIQEYYQEQNRKKALENLLIEGGKLREFKKTYEPKK